MKILNIIDIDDVNANNLDIELKTLKNFELTKFFILKKNKIRKILVRIIK